MVHRKDDIALFSDLERHIKNRRSDGRVAAQTKPTKMDRDRAIRNWGAGCGHQTLNCGGQPSLDILLGRVGTTVGSSPICERRVLGEQAFEGRGAHRRHCEISSLHINLTIKSHEPASSHKREMNNHPTPRQSSWTRK